MIYILYHASCLDGFGSAYAAWKRFGDEATYVPVRYQETWPEEVQSIGNDIFVLDFSYDRETLLFQHQLANHLTVIDHHKSAAEALEGLDFAHFDMTKSGAVLAWEHFHKFTAPPKLIEHIGDRDLWKFELQGTEAVCEALWSNPRDFVRWDGYANDPGAFKRLKAQGQLLLMAKERVVNQICAQAFLFEHEGVQAVACNSPVHASEVCHTLLERFPQAAFAAGFQITADQKFRWHFRSRKDSGVDVSKIALPLGGGGHENAAGANTVFSILPGNEADLLSLLKDMACDEICDYDHGGLCQSHYRDAPCPHERMRKLIADRAVIHP